MRRPTANKSRRFSLRKKRKTDVIRQDPDPQVKFSAPLFFFVPQKDGITFMKTDLIRNSVGNKTAKSRTLCSAAILIVGILFNLLPVVEAEQIMLYNTGVDDMDNLLPLGVQDSHWNIVSPSPDSVGPAWTLSDQHPLVYVQTLSSEWIWLNTDGTTPDLGHVPNYYFRETFFLPPGSDPSTALIMGSWAVDNDGTILLNGNTPSGTNLTLSGGGSQNFTQFYQFTITGGFVSGLNTLDFVVDDYGAVGGLNVTNLTGVVSAVPEPGDVGADGLRRQSPAGRNTLPEPRTSSSNLKGRKGVTLKGERGSERGKGVSKGERGSVWGCIDLTDSGQRVKKPRSPHEDTVKQTSSHQSELHESIQTGGAGIMAFQWSQRREGGG